MFGHRTPVKRAAGPQSPKKSPQRPEKVRPATSNVRRSIGEWESGKAKQQSQSPTVPKSSDAAPPSKPQHSDEHSLATRREPVEAPGTLAKPEAPKYPNRTAEARACLNKAKLYLGNSRNLKTEIKTEVLAAINRLYDLVKESEKGRPVGPDCPAMPQPEPAIVEADHKIVSCAAGGHALMAKLEEHSALIKEHGTEMRELKDAINKNITERAACLTAAPVQSGPLHLTYAEAASQQKRAPTAIHSAIVASADVQDSCEDIVQRIRTVVDAKTSGIRVDRLRKAKDQKVVIGCSSKAELARVTERLRTPQAKFLVEERANKDPLIVLKYVLAYNTDEDVVKALAKQNGHLLGDLSLEDLRAQVRYRRRARNPHESHIVLSVSPQGWQRLTTAGHVHVDLQRVRVLDQSPLVQCIRCLRYGHSRKTCTETADLCTHCGDAHMCADCPSRLAAEKPTCRNCKLAKMENAGHNALDSSCPTREKWEALARSSVAYC